MKGQAIVTAALEVIGVASPADGAPSPADSDVAIRHLDLMRKSWNTRGLALHAVERSTFAWPISTASRTIGAGAQLVGTRPLCLVAAKAIPSGQTTEQPVNVLTRLRFAALPNKAQTARVYTDLLYEATGRSIGTLTVWPVPTVASTLILHVPSLLAEVTLDGDLVIPEGYDDALTLSLAKRCSSVFGKKWTKELEEQLRDAWAAVQSANIRIPDEVSMPAGIPGGRRGRTVSDAKYDAGLV